MKKKILSVMLTVLMILSVATQSIGTTFAVDVPERENGVSENIVINIEKKSFTYTGSEIFPEAEVYRDGNLCQENADYMLIYKNNISAGAGTVTAIFYDSELGEVSADFKINPAPISRCSVSLSTKSYTYNNKAYKPRVNVENIYGERLSSKNYSCTYKNNKKVGKASVIVSGRGNYNGRKTLNFVIRPKVNRKSVTIYAGQKYKLKVKSSSKVKYKSLNSKVASVTKTGVITGNKKGKATITVNSNKQNTTVKVKIRRSYISLPKTYRTVVGYSKTLKAKVAPPHSRITWKSSNSRVATVSSKGVVKGIAVGNATITARIKINGKTYSSSCKVTVQKLKKYYEGTYKVGRDIPAGEYVLYTTNDDLGYFSINSSSSDSLSSIIANDNFYNNSIVKVRNGEYLKLSRCYAVNGNYVSKIKNYADGGMYRVGKDIQPGEYRLKQSGDISGYYEVNSDSRHDLFDIVSNDNFNNYSYVTVQKGQYLSLSRCHLERYFG